MKLLNKRFLLLLIFSTLSINLFGGGLADSQYSSDIKVYEGALPTEGEDKEEISRFKIVRSFSGGMIKVVIKSTKANESYYVAVLEENDNGNVTALPGNVSIAGNESSINIDIREFTKFSFNGDIKYIKDLPHTISATYSDQVVSRKVQLINKKDHNKSFQFIIDINPSIDIKPEQTMKTEDYIKLLEEDPEIRRYIKKQILGSRTFTQTEEHPFPLSNIENEYRYEVVKTLFSDKIEVKKEISTIDVNYFDSLYNYVYNSNYEQGESIIQRLLRIYYDKDKPLFHNYINKAMNNRFHYSEYNQLTPQEGQELATHALKYLTWGLEYTPDENHRSLVDGVKYPSQTLDKNENIETWLTNYDGLVDNAVNRGKNYLPFEPVNIAQAVNLNDPTYTQDKINKLKNIASGYFTGNIADPSSLDLTTPFTYTENNVTHKITGSSLPYVKGGVDSPRTFNYKMLEQRDVIDRFLTNKASSWYGANSGANRVLNDYLFSINNNKSTAYTASEYYFFVGDGTADIDEGDKPFMPGFDSEAFKEETSKNAYKGINLAGVDSIGLLSGAVAMTSYYNRILAVNNTSKSKNLNGYFKMNNANYTGTTPQALLDNGGLPVFTAAGHDTLDNIRLNRYDIERSTVIVPDLSDIQVGDLLVRGKENPEIAIVIDTGHNNIADGTQTVFNMGKVLVLSVTESDGRVALNYWGNNGIYSSFSETPKDFILRRLIRYTGNIGEDGTVNPIAFTAAHEAAETWDPFVYQPQPMVADLDIVSDINNSHWMPNTGELFHINSIRMGTINEETGNFVEQQETADVIIAPPTDLNYSVTAAEDDNSKKGRNINVNKGDGFAFYAVKTLVQGTEPDEKIHYDAIKLATFKINTNSNSRYDRYTVDYVDDIFTEEGICKNGFTLEYTNATGLTFSFGENNKFTKFAIRPLEANIRPGDDILLNFNMIIDNKATPVHTRKEDFMAVYDEKLLWRANLYIDDRPNAAQDWNDLNPWNAPPTSAEADNFGPYTDNGIIKRFFKMNKSQVNHNGPRVFDIEYYSFFSDWKISDEDKVWYGPNEWNRVMETNEQRALYATGTFERDGITMLWEDLTGLDTGVDADGNAIEVRGNGMQNVSFPSAVYYHQDYSSRLISTTTVYNYIRTTTPFEYNYQMLQQYNAMKQEGDNLRNALTAAQTANPPNQAAIDAAQAAFDASIYTNMAANVATMLPPHDDLNPVNPNFSGGADKPLLLQLWKRYDPETFKPAAKDVLDYKASPGLPFKQPSMPDNFGDPDEELRRKTLPGDDTQFTNREAGVDCGGLIYMSEAYLRTPYISRDVNGDTPSAITGMRFKRTGNKSKDWYTHDCGPGTEDEEKDFTPNNNLYFIVSHNEYNNTLNTFTTEDLKKAVPGDVIYYFGYHVMLVNNVELVNGVRVVDVNTIEIIESTHSGISNIFGVGNTNTLFNYRTRDWFLGRIKTQ